MIVSDGAFMGLFKKKLGALFGVLQALNYANF